MDSPTPSATIDTLPGGEERRIDLFASFNDEVFRTEGITPLTGEVIVTYALGDRPAEQRQSVTYDLHDKTALTWDDDRKVAAFITPADSALRNYTSYIRQACKGELVDGFCKRLQEAMQIFEALNVLGVLYQIDPRSPFTEAQENTMVVDSVSLPRDTLKRITGDCDDLTVLYCSLLETVGITSGFITIPGHIFACFNTGVPARDYKQVHPDRGMSVNVDGELWIPVEITMIGKESFLTAWRKGIEEYTQFDSKPKQRNIYITPEAQEVYRPVGLKETDLGLQYGEEQRIVSAFKEGLGKLVDYAVAEYRQAAEKRNNKRLFNKLGIAYAQFKQYEKAEGAFGQALQLDGSYLSASVNLGNVAYLRGAYRKAIDSFSAAFASLEKRGRGDSRTGAKILLNVSKAHYALEEFEQSRTYYEQAKRIDERLVAEYSYLASVSADGGGSARAAEAEETSVIFIEDEEAE
jgi:tetratricopeptide (TPR) repeat protein